MIEALTVLHPGQRLRGILTDEVVTLVGVTHLDDALVEIAFRDSTGRTAERALTQRDLTSLDLVIESDAGPAFDADPDDFRLVSEALRIKYAALYDPMVAVNSSDVEPLPHQIRAVYEELLPRVPLRFLLADDPGAGKTIMAGLYLKELILRADGERIIVVAPGGLVEQWRDELAQKFGLRFEIFSRDMVDDAQGRNVFLEHSHLIVRMDQLSRSDDLMEQLADVTWDVAVVDEAHRMSAHYSSWAGEVDETRRFRLGRVLSETAHNFLLMTATPHAGKEEDFQLFMSLLDRDRFEGQFRRGIHRTDTRGLMRRMVKEDLLTFDGRPLFPERRAYTVEYELSPAERELYELVTDYVRTEMGRAERIAQAGDRRRGNNVGFALTVLQRRLASSPEAILRSLERRRARLDTRARELQWETEAQRGAPPPSTDAWQFDLDDIAHLDDLEEELTDAERERLEAQVDQVVDLATAAQTIPELHAEIAILDDLISVARRVRLDADDKKWVQLRTILDEQLLSHADSGTPRKIIIFTEHRDTLDYLHQRITTQLGRADAVITIHGGTRREDRKAAQERFTHDRETVVLLATDAAGEGLNLQRAHLMVNYDLPWNPNRIEQRFGRIHRIGQHEVCHLWNMVARDTREGDVFARLLTKIDQMSAAYSGSLFNVLGEGSAFQERPLRDLLIEAIRYGDLPEVKARLDEIIDASVSDGLHEMRAERALHPEMFDTLDLEGVRARMEAARERRLQPGYLNAFFRPAFERLGGTIRRREHGRYEITRVPSRLIEIARRIDRLAPLAERYERVTFDPARLELEGRSRAALITPGHPLLNAVIEATIDDLGEVLRHGTVFVDRRAKQSDAPELLFTVEQRLTDASGSTISHHFDYPLLARDGTFSISPLPAYLEYEAPVADEAAAIRDILTDDWVRTSHELKVRAATYREGLEPRIDELHARLEAETARTRTQVRERLLAEINHWDREYVRLSALEREGTVGRVRAEHALARSQQLEARLERRLRELDDASTLAAKPAVVRATALVVPSDLLAVDADISPFARQRDEVERRAVEATLAAERALGRTPVEMARNNPGYDIRSTDRAGNVYSLEVKGRIAGADTFMITSNEVAYAQTQGERHRLALVIVSPDGPDGDQLRYVGRAFDHLEPASTTKSLTEELRGYWARGAPPF